MTISRADFAVGQIVRHELFAYRGVIIDVDPEFQGTEQWYKSMAKSLPPKDQPWYRVLVDGAAHQTYVAQRNLTDDGDRSPIQNPYVDDILRRCGDGTYVLRTGLS
ncbi:MAG: heat shock protein HspQ [Gammaproteobacteria bacterium]|nr:heat shock protein HspQ [Gammaproteobacteria bacterium]MDH3466754.1 heat shock protein HspQ [Gammaproteobacteria bacterium]